MKNSILYILSFALIGFLASTDLSAQNLAGMTINSTLGTQDGATCKLNVGVQNGGRIFRDGAPSSCPSKACPGGFPEVDAAWEEFHFRNIVSIPTCITVNVNGGGCQTFFDVHGHIQTENYEPPTNPGDFCTMNPSFLGDQGGSGTNSFSVEVEGCETFYLVFTNTFNGVNNCDFSFTIAPDPTLDLRCGDETMCIEKVIIGGTPVPTMTQWGLFLFGLIVLTLGVVTIYNMSTSRVAERS
ncbi:MAG: hypothetical protein R3275_00790 [Saprospiraceae bacterium]|nr:hypothetical protein [Saprospiraceae bacterium]